MSEGDKWLRPIHGLFFLFFFTKRLIAFEPNGPWAEARFVEYYRGKVRFWSENRSDFRQFISRRYDAIKLLGGGHAAGLFGIAAFFSSSHPTGWIAVAAKACWLLFGVGVALFSLAYWQIYQFEQTAEAAFERLANEPEGDELTRLCAQLSGRSSLTAYLTMNLITWFGVAAILVFLGVLVHDWGAKP